MRSGVSLLVIAATAACSVSPGALRSQAPFFHISSQRSAAEIGKCISSAWESRSATVTSTPRGNGFTLTLKQKSPVPNTEVLVDVEDSGNTRSITVYSEEGAADQKLRGDIEVCASEAPPAP